MNNLKLVVAVITGEIYLTRILKNGNMSDKNKEVTNEAVVTVMEWFMWHKHHTINSKKTNGEKVWLFFTEDKEKAERIHAILKEGENNENE